MTTGSKGRCRGRLAVGRFAAGLATLTLLLAGVTTARAAAATESPDIAQRDRPTAQVVVEATDATVPLPPALAPSQIEAIRREILAPDNVLAAVERVLPQDPQGRQLESPQQVASRLMPRLSVQVRVGSKRQLRVAIQANDTDELLAVQVVNALANCYADQCRGRIREDARRVGQQTHEAAARAREELQQARTNLERFLEQHFAWQEQLSREVAEGRPDGATDAAGPQSPPAAETPQAARAAVPAVDNPAWQEGQRQLAALYQRRSALLQVRTNAHPDVVDNDSRIRELELYLTQLSRQTPAAPDPTQPLQPPGFPAREETVGPSWRQRATAGESQRQVEMYGEIREAFDRAVQRDRQATEAEQTAANWTRGLPSVEVLPAVVQQLQGPLNRQSRGMFWVALGALVGSAGVGLLVASARADSRLASPADALALINAPLLGAVPAGSDPEESAPLKLWRETPRWLVATLGGTALAAGGVVLVVAAWMM